MLCLKIGDPMYVLWFGAAHRFLRGVQYYSPFAFS